MAMVCGKWFWTSETKFGVWLRIVTVENGSSCLLPPSQKHKFNSQLFALCSTVIYFHITVLFQLVGLREKLWLFQEWTVPPFRNEFEQGEIRLLNNSSKNFDIVRGRRTRNKPRVVGHLIVVRGWTYTSLPCPFDIPLPYPPLMPSPLCTAKSSPPEWSSIRFYSIVSIGDWFG